jgi:hypothetical protein
MKRNEMNAHQKVLFDLTREAISDTIGAYENTMMDFRPETKEYKEAEEFLNQGHEALAKVIYDEVMDMCKRGANASHARFAGSEFLKERIDRRLTKLGY